MRFNVDLDVRSWEQINAFIEGNSMWDLLMHQGVAEELAKSAKEYMAPLLHVRPQHTGDLEKSITWNIQESADGFEIDFYGLLYGLWVDTGNFPPSATITRADGGLFPIREYKGGTPVLFSKTIHGMGSQNPNAPTHYSEKTAKYLAEDEAVNIASDHLETWLESVIIR